MFRRTVDGAILDFGTTGALRDSNLLMYDRQTESWWQEFGGEGVIGHYAGARLEQLYLSIVSWADFKAAHPYGRVLSRPDSGSGRAYGQNPYAGYDRPGSEPFLFRGEKDPRLPAVERVVAIERGGDAWAVSFTTLAQERVVSASIGGEDIVVFWTPGTASALDSGSIASGRDVGAAGIFSPQGPDGNMLTFAPDTEGRIVDMETGSRWDIFGRAISGSLEGAQLTPAPGRIGQLWFSWAVYRPDTVVYPETP